MQESFPGFENNIQRAISLMQTFCPQNVIQVLREKGRFLNFSSAETVFEWWISGKRSKDKETPLLLKGKGGEVSGKEEERNPT